MRKLLPLFSPFMIQKAQKKNISEIKLFAWMLISHK